MAAAERERTGRLHRLGLSAKQRLHLAALLILICALPLAAQSDIDLDPTISQAEFETFSRLIAQGIYATPVDSARARGLLGFDIGVAMTAVPVDVDAAYWQRAVGDDFSLSDHVVVPRLVATKGLSFATVSAMVARIPDSDIQILGGALDIPILGGGVVTPTLAVRGAYSTLRGVGELELSTYGVELFLSKGFGPVTPYAAVGRARSDSTATIELPDTTSLVLTDEFDSNRITVGVKLSLLVPKIIVEATQGEERSYAAKVSFGF